MSARGLAESAALKGLILRNTAWSTLAVVAAPVLALLFGGLTLRYLGLEQAGYALTVGAVFSIVGRFATLGVSTAALPYLSAAIRDDDEILVRRLMGALWSVFCGSAAATAILALIFIPWFTRWAKCPLSPPDAAIYLSVFGLSHGLGQIAIVPATVLRAANRYDLVTLATTPLAFLTGLFACILLPLFPSLLTAAAVSGVAAGMGLVVTAWLAFRAVPAFGRPLSGFNELPGLIRCGSWLTMSNVFASLTTGVDELVIAGWCGPAALPPWAIGKRFWVTTHTFLAQHVEHLVPLLGSLRAAGGARVDRIAAAMHWYVVSLAGVVYSLMAWSGEAAVGLVAGRDVAPACRPAILSFSLFGLGFALAIVPVTLALAKGVSRPAFDVSVILQVALFVPLCGLAVFTRVPWIYYAPVLGLPILPLTAVAAAARLGNLHAVQTWIQPVAVPLAAGGIAIVASQFSTGFSTYGSVFIGGILAASVLIGTLLIERFLGLNVECHVQLGELANQGFRQGRQLTGRVLGAWQRMRS